ncbi:glycosyl transferase family protein [Geothrix sp. PMB-07]|uniref:glycosyl transferase family protein n=1 Tax=Geothrix sp. PMB-07 TaxID=3068640 RepID=UPI0027411EF5|nr:glycosyl transferase family protein [Geothrix sp. PMB-07]WLT33100.1 glycosyl transferase family protein [Geothrix sp. PMB-07]
MDLMLQVIFGLAVFVNVLVFVSSCDDAFIDGYFWIRQAFRKLTIQRKHPRFRLEDLHERVEAPFAIMVPAWKEFDVIAKMIENTNATMEYRNYQIFVGTYLNDGETQAEVDRMARRYKNVQRVDVPHFGPTCKADCLNSIVDAVFRHEKETNQAFAGLVIHDSEDVIHPLELKVFNHLIDRKDLIQLPVLSLERDWHQWVAGTYQDDFAEWHSKDLVVRESLTGLVPCAGTGMCYSRRALGALMEETGEAPFNTSTLTEDYDFSFRLKKFGLKQAFVKIPLQYSKHIKDWRGERTVERHDLLGVREFFPSTFRTAYRQRARWILGIGLQGWETMGWKGDLKAKYFMFRDRKGLFTSLVTILAYLLFTALGSILIFQHLGIGGAHLSAGFRPGGWLMRLMQVNAVFMLNRLVQRFIFVRRLYGTVHGLLAIPRILVSNLVNFAAAVRAWRQYVGHRVSGRALTWDKTAHAYPTSADMQPFRRKLGEILIQWNELDKQRLDEALSEQEKTGRRLGTILMERYGLSEANLADAIASQSNLPRSLLHLDSLEQTQSLLPHALAVQHGWVPLGVGEKEELLIGVSAPPSEEAKAEALKHLRVAPKFFILTESETARALAFLITGSAATGVAGSTDSGRLGQFLDLKLGEILIQWNQLDEHQLQAALEEHGNTGERIGRVLMERQGLSEASLADAIAFQANLPRKQLDMGVVEQLHAFLPRTLALQHGWIPLGIGNNHELLIGAANPPTKQAMAEFRDRFTVMPQFFILTESEVACALAYLILGEASAEDIGSVVGTQLNLGFSFRKGRSAVQLRDVLAGYCYAKHGSLRAFLEDRGLVESVSTERSQAEVRLSAIGLQLSTAAKSC